MEWIFSLVAFVLLLTGMPISMILAAMTFLLIYSTTSLSPELIPQQMFRAVDSTILMAVPFFILAGNIMTRGSLARRIIKFINSIVGGISGGLAVTSVLACMFFAAISGSSPATLVAIGSIMIPALLQAQYGQRFSVGLLTCAGSLGILIPPSIPMIVYCLIMGTSVTRQFAAGFGPGIVMGIIFMIYSFLISRREGWHGEKRESWRQIFQALYEGFWALMLPFIVLGGIYSGIMTPTEAAAVSVGYGLLIDLLIYRELKISELPRIMAESAVFSGCLMFILACAMAFSWYLTSEQIPAKISTILLEFVGRPWVFLMMVNIIFLILGCFIDVISAMLIVCPLLLPMLQELKIDLYHFGIIVVFNMEIGFMTPPFGVNLFVSSGVTKLPLLYVTRSVIPFLLLMLFALILITYLPGISLYIPDLFAIK